MDSPDSGKLDRWHEVGLHKQHTPATGNGRPSAALANAIEALEKQLSFVGWVEAGEVYRPVSYTHLDVYKRQAANRRSRKKRLKDLHAEQA